MDFCRVFVAKDGGGSQVEVPILVFQVTESAGLTFPPSYTAPMKAHVKVLRSGGERISARDIQSDSGTRGDMTMVMIAGRTELKLADPNDSQLKPLIPVLYHARLVTMHGNRMLYQGLTAPRDDGGQAQEWSVEVLP
jgi:hypothetical protein